jgi:predicted acylesterase/phospholipase RssA
MKFDIVFEGGGAKGFGFIGALKAFEQHQHEAERLIGTSAGAVIASLLAAGYTADAMRQIVAERAVIDGRERSRLATFLDAPDPQNLSDADLQDSQLTSFFQHCSVFAPPGGLSQHLLMKIPLYAHLFSLLEFGGWYVGDSFTSWLREKLDVVRSDIRLSDCTLMQFYEATKRDLSLIASDTSVGEMLVLNYRTAPDCPLIAAVRMSMSFPFIWQEITWKEEWGTYRGRWKAGNIIADGGLLSNFPIHLLIRPAVHGYIQEIMGEEDTTKQDVGVMGLLLDHNRALDTANTVGSTPQIDHWFLHRPLRLLNTALGAYDFDFIQENDAFICRIPVQGYGVTDFDLSEIRLEALIGSGYNAMVDHLRKAPGGTFMPQNSTPRALK